MLLARRELTEFFQLVNRSAEIEGKQAVFKKKFVVGWDNFARNPCYKSAVAFIKGSPEYAPQIFEYFVGSCPGGQLYKTGIKTAMSFTLGDYSLDMSSAMLNNLIELTDQEYEYFPRQFIGEKIFHAPQTDFLDHSWGIMIGIVDGKPYKLSANLELDDQQKAMEIMQSAFKVCENQLGTPTEEKQCLFVWDTIDGNIILQIAHIMGTLAINIYVTSNK